MICVEFDSLGALVKEWMRLSGLNSSSFARLVGNGTSRQKIDYLVKPPPGKEKATDARPRWIEHMARAMGTTADDLYALRMPPPLKPVPASAHPIHAVRVRSEIAEAIVAKLESIPDPELRLRAGYASLRAIDELLQAEAVTANVAGSRK